MNQIKETESQHIFSFKVAKFLGLYQILNPNATKICGYNVYQIIIIPFLLYLSSIWLMSPFGFYNLLNDVTAFTLFLGCVLNFSFSCFKIVTFMYHSKDIWKSLDITRFDFLSYEHYDKNIFKKWQGKTIRISYLCLFILYFALLIWTMSPFVLYKNKVTLRKLDGSSNVYRLNVFNMFNMLSVSNEIHNKYFSVFHFAEGLILYIFLLFSMILDTYMVIMCFSFTCQLEVICKAIGSLGHNSLNDELNFYGEEPLMKKCNVYDELKKIITDNQKIMKNLSDYYIKIQNVVLAQIFVTSSSHVMIWFIAAISFFGGEKGDVILAVKLFCVNPLFTFEFFMSCYLFGIINDKKDSLIFALYSSNWTEMDMKSKKLILFAMKISNAHQLKMKFTNMRIVNLEMFTSTIRMCYSIFSMLLNTL